MMRIALTADHNGVALKNRLAALLTAQGHEVDDRAPGVGVQVVDYPRLCQDAGRVVVDGRAERAIVIGGSGQGEAVACNKIPGIRAGLCQDVWSTSISRANNDSNVLVLGAKVVTPELAEQIVDTWLTTPFSGGVHERRLEQIAAIERGEQLS
jgi:ribose 5-phosphate isomerase B